MTSSANSGWRRGMSEYADAAYYEALGAASGVDYGLDSETKVLVLGPQSMETHTFTHFPAWEEPFLTVIDEPKLSRQARRIKHKCAREKHRPAYLDIKKK